MEETNTVYQYMLIVGLHFFLEGGGAYKKMKKFHDVIILARNMYIF